MGNQRIIGIDIGATNIHIGIVEQGKVIDEIYIPTSSTASEQQVINEIIEGVEKLFTKEVIGIGVGVPGLIDEEEGIVYDLWNITSWKEVYLKKHLEDHFKTPVYITNDANTFALGVKLYGPGKEYKNMIGLTLGSGFGTGIIINHELYSGTLSSAGELADIPYLDGNLEDYCSGKFFRKQSGMSGSELYALAQKNDKNALDIFYQYGNHLGYAIKLILYILSPEAIFLGGSVSGAYNYFKEGLNESLEKFPFRRVSEKLKIQPSEVRNISLLGAAALVDMRKKGSHNNFNKKQ